MLWLYRFKEGDSRNRQDPDMQESDGSREGSCVRGMAGGEGGNCLLREAMNQQGCDLWDGTGCME